MRVLVAGAVLGVVAGVVVAACSSKSLVPCAEQSTCDPLGAICAGGYCRKPDDPELDLGTPDLYQPPPDFTGACADDSECTGRQAPVCDPMNHICRPCGAASECAASASGPLCQTTGPLAGACVSCLDESQCAAGHQVCDPYTGTCAACTASPQCGSGICDAGSCVIESDITYVDNKQAPCAGADGTRTKAYCTIADALTAMGSTRHYMYVAGSSTSYAGANLGPSIPTPLTIAGPGPHASPPARLIPFNPTSFSVEVVLLGGGATGKSVTLDSLDLYGQPGVSAQDDAIVFMGADASTLTIKDTFVHSGKGSAIYQYRGSVTVDHSEIASAAGTAIQFGYMTPPGIFTMRRSYVHDNGAVMSLSNVTSAVIENNFIFSNGGASAASTLSISSTASAVTFRANTVTGNAVAAGQYVLDCQTSAFSISDSIVAGNTHTGDTQVRNCALTNVVTGGDSALGAIQLMPAFVSTTDPHLVLNDQANVACCVDKLGSGPGVDIDGTVRPLGAGYDIGAHEVQ